MDFKDYYKALGVAESATDEEIKRAFRKAARKYHPDVNKDASADQKFKDVNEAYEVLKDPEKRAAYDQLGQDPSPGAGGVRPPPAWDSGYEFSQGNSDNEEVFSDFFETLFRQRQSGPTGMRTGRGSDSHARVEISVEDAFQGTSRVLSLRSPAVGPDGQVRMHDRSISVKIPKGVFEGQHIRLKGQGSPSLDGGPAGDLFLEVTFAAHPVYRPEGKNLYLDLPIAPWEAALGGHVVLPTPSGKVDLRIPKNARSGQTLRLKGKGLPGAAAGDIFATLKIVNPKVTTSEARELFEKMAEKMPFDPRAHLGG